jgi:hypothetical protein
MVIIQANTVIFAAAGAAAQQVPEGPYSNTFMVLGVWIAALLTFAMYSFLYKDNPVYKFGEHLYVGITVGYFIVLTWYNVMWPNLFLPLKTDARYYWYLFIPGVLGVTMLFRFSRSLAWVSRYALAFYVAVGAGLAIPAIIQASLLQQMLATFTPLWVFGADAGTALVQLIYCAIISGIVITILYIFFTYPFTGITGIFYRVFMLAVAGVVVWLTFPILAKNWDGLGTIMIFIGVLSVLVYFFFSVEHKGTIGKISQVGIWFLMVSFGASFGYTVMARISLLIGRMQFLLQEWLGLKIG